VPDLRAHAGQRLAEGAEVPEELDRVVLPGGRFLVSTCRGPHSRLPEAWSDADARAIPEGGHRLRDAVPFERDISRSWDTAPEDRITDVWVPLERGSPEPRPPYGQSTG
jgi:AraC family transcriptional regulator